MTLKRYDELKVNDEIYSYCDRRWRRCRVAKYPQVYGDGKVVVVWVQWQSRTSALVRLSFQAAATIEVMEERRLKPFVASIDRYSEAIQAMLLPGMAEQTVEEIASLITSRFKKPPSYSGVAAACNELARSGKLRKRRQDAYRYRPLLPLEVGYPVVEFYGGKTERYGWICGFMPIRATGEVFPLAQWLDGTRSPVQDLTLDPVISPLMRMRIVRDFQLKTGREVAAERFQPIDWHLLTELYCERNGREVLNKETLLQIAKDLGLIRQSAQRLNDKIRNDVTSYLNEFYPDWRTARYQGRCSVG